MSPKDATRRKTDKKLAAAQARVDELTAEVTHLRSRVASLTAEAETWRKKVDKQKSRVEKIRAKAEVAIAEATQAARKRAKSRAKKKVRQAIADHPRAEPLALRGAPRLPEPTWTVAELRVAAREQGVAGYARMRKEQLLAVLI